MPVFAISPGVYSQEQDLSTRVTAIATTIASAVFASPKGSLTPFFISSSNAFLSQFGSPNLTFGYGHHSCLAYLMQGSNLWASRVVDSALYGTSTVGGDLEGTSNTTQFPIANSAGSATNYLGAQQDFYKIIFSGPILTGQTLTAAYTIVGQDQAGNIINVIGSYTNTFVTSSVATLAAFAVGLSAAINTSLTGTPYVGTMPFAYIPANSTNAVAVLGAQGVITNITTTITGTGSLPTATYEDTKLFDVFAVDPGAWNGGIGYNITNVDLGTAQRGQIVFNGPILTGNTITVTYTNTTTGVVTTNTSSPLVYTTSSNNTLAALAALLAAAPYSLSATVNQVLGSVSNNRTISVIAPNAYANMQISVVVNIGSAGSAATATYTNTLNAILPTNTFTFNVYQTSNVTTPVETFVVSLAKQLDGYGASQNIADVINLGPRASQYVNIYQPVSSQTAQFTNNSTSITLLTGGADGNAVTSADLINGWAQYATREQVEMRMMIGCGYTLTGLQQYMDNIAQSRKDCISIIDVPSSSQSAAAAVSYRNNVLNINSSYSALYSPDVLIQDSFTNSQLYIPPSGYVAAVYAKTDKVAATWFAPAGLNRGNLSSVIIGLRYTYVLGDRNLLYPAQVNWIQKMPGLGYPINSANTLQSIASALSNVSVRRLLIFMEVSIVDTLAFYQWEPDDHFTQQAVISVVSNFVAPIQNARGISQFLVVSDATNNSATDQDEGVLNINFYVKPILPAQFILLTTTVTSSGANFAELSAAAPGLA